MYGATDEGILEKKTSIIVSIFKNMIENQSPIFQKLPSLALSTAEKNSLLDEQSIMKCCSIAKGINAPVEVLKNAD